MVHAVVMANVNVTVVLVVRTAVNHDVQTIAMNMVFVTRTDLVAVVSASVTRIMVEQTAVSNYIFLFFVIF